MLKSKYLQHSNGATSLDASSAALMNALGGLNSAAVAAQHHRARSASSTTLLTSVVKELKCWSAECQTTPQTRDRAICARQHRSITIGGNDTLIPQHTSQTHTTFALPASHTTLDQLGSHDGDAGGSTFTTHPVAAPAAHDGPFVDQYKSASTSFGVLKRCPVLVLYRSRIHAHAVSRRRHAQTLQYAS
jgi:hypothetical protein